MHGHAICIFGVKDENGEKLFRAKDSNDGTEQIIPVRRSTFREEFESQNQRFAADTQHIGTGYTIELKKK